ncbi:SDR family oxidoreductase [Chloroflexi bacterium TSY]|nr:SDR family oxidoreductase [Chloroflexi bacterium TSY]
MIDLHSASPYSDETSTAPTVLITGGTRGLGKAIGLEFAKVGATIYLTHRWGSADESEIMAEFIHKGLKTPCIVESDVSNIDDTRRLMQTIQDESGTLDIIISNVAFGKTVTDLGDLRRRALERSLAYSAWPVVDLVQAAYEIFGCYPRYVIGVSSDGGQVCHPNYDLIGVSKSVLETLCRYLAFRLKSHGTRVNAIRPGFLDTASARATFGDGVFEELEARHPQMLLDLQEVAKACVALCSGYMDAVTGQVITIDEGWGLASPIDLLKSKESTEGDMEFPIQAISID